MSTQDDRYYQRLLIAVIHKLSPGQPVRITEDDLQKLKEDFNNKPFLFVHTMDHAAEISVVSHERAQLINDFQELQQKANTVQQ